MNRLGLYIKLTRLDKPIGILLLLWPTLGALWLASNGHPDWRLFAIFTLGTALMRSAGCAINDFADRDFDKHVKRTAERPLTAGKIAAWEALAIAALLALIAFALILPLNLLTKQLSVAAVLIAASYPYFKRFFAIPQAYLGIAFGFGIPMAFAAVQDAIPVGSMDITGCQHPVGDCLRHGIRDGGSRRRLENRHQDFGHHVWSFRRRRRDVVLRGERLDHLGGRLAIRFAHLVPGRLAAGRRLCAVPLQPDSRARPPALLCGVPSQQLAGSSGVCRYSVELQSEALMFLIAAEFLS